MRRFLSYLIDIFNRQILALLWLFDSLYDQIISVHLDHSV